MSTTTYARQDTTDIATIKYHMSSYIYCSVRVAVQNYVHNIHNYDFTEFVV